MISVKNPPPPPSGRVTTSGADDCAPAAAAAPQRVKHPATAPDHRHAGHSDSFHAATREVQERIPDAYFGDIMYYAVGDLTPQEIEAVSPKTHPRGSVVVWDRGQVISGRKAEQMLLNNEVKCVAIPGVGSSAYGALAMAKQMSGALNQPMAAIVAGVGGVSGVMQDGPEGFIEGRDANANKESYQRRHSEVVSHLWNPFEAWASLFNPALAIDRVQMLVDDLVFHSDSTLSAASNKLTALMEKGFKPEYVIGHSKGNMDAASAFYRLSEKGFSNLLATTRFIGLGMGVFTPKEIRAEQYIGAIDLLGKMNTVNSNDQEVVEWGPLVDGRTHSLSTDSTIAPTAMPVKEIIDDAVDRLSDKKEET